LHHREVFASPLDLTLITIHPFTTQAVPGCEDGIARAPATYGITAIPAHPMELWPGRLQLRQLRQPSRRQNRNLRYDDQCAGADCSQVPLPILHRPCQRKCPVLVKSKAHRGLCICSLNDLSSLLMIDIVNCIMYRPSSKS
jgi:hypothetical protein